MQEQVWTPAVWVQLAVGLMTVVMTLSLTLFTAARSDRKGRRSEWWKRTEWAVRLALASEEPARQIGIRSLALLTESELVPIAERDIALTAYRTLVPAGLPAAADEETDND